MDKNFTNTDDKFKDAFDSWEADFSPSEMRADWSKLSSKIAPLQTPPATQPLSNTFWTAGKMLGLVSSAAILTTAGIMLYNTYIYDGEKIPSAYNPAVTIENNNTAADDTHIENNQSIAGDLNTEEDKAFSGQPIYGNGNTENKNAANNGKENTVATDDKAVVQANDNSGKSTDLINNPNQPAANNRNDNGEQGEIKKIAGSISKKDLKYSDTVF
ncbi:MAG: hypothetical protein ACXWDO_12825, partial [Bacteroidia bacterium]